MLLQFCIFCPWCDPVMGGSPPGSAGVPPAPSLAQPGPSPPLGSTGNGALPLLRPGPCAMALLRLGRCCSRPQGGCLQHRTEAQRQPKGQHAGGTPALPGVSSRRCGGECLAGDFSESRPAPFGKLPFARKSSPRPSRRGGSSESETSFVSGKRCGLALLGRWLHAAAYCESQGGASLGWLA